MEQGTIKMEETRKQPSKSEVIGSFISMGMVGFCFGIGLRDNKNGGDEKTAE